MRSGLATAARSLALPRLTSEVELPGWTRPAVALAILQAVTGLAGYLFGATPGQPRGSTVPEEVWALSLAAFAVAGGFLLYGGQRDKRAVSLGAAFLLVSTYFSDWGRLRLAAVLADPWPGLLAAVSLIEVGALLPAFFWLFVRHFPDSPLPLRPRRLLNSATRVAIGIGAALMAVNLLRVAGDDPLGLGMLMADAETTAYEEIVMLLSLGAFAFAVWRARIATGPENRRFRLFIAAIALGLVPIMVEVLLEGVFPAYLAWAEQPRVDRVLQLVILPLLLSVPFTTGYSVLVHQVLDVRLIARRALQYALARFSALVLAAVPMTLLVAYLVAHRHRTLAELASGPRALGLAAAAVVGGLALGHRQALLDAVDRRFFREQYDARRLLTLLVDNLRSARDLGELAALVAGGIDHALHLETVALAVDDPERGELVDPDGRVRPLAGASPLANLVAGHRDPLEVELDSPRSPLRRLPEADRHWLVDGRFQLLVPMIATDGTLLGVIALGGKKSELPFLAEDRELLAAVAASASLALELRRATVRRADGEALPAATVEPAGECEECGTVHRSAEGSCRGCGGDLVAAGVPFVLPGRFRFERRIGTGGMGVVYRASDLTLGRTVAVKTLRRLSPEDALRLRREARTAAAVSHPNLAAVFGVETWSGTPLLVMELLEGGTLGDRLAAGPFAAGDALELGITLAAALDHLHAADILHRDIKPTNIGYARQDTPKLMDFGIARLRYERRADVGATASEQGASGGGEPMPATSIWHRAPALLTESGQLIGTLPYLAPEALDGVSADARFDLWSLTLVLYECLTGRRVFDAGRAETLERVRRADVPDLAAELPGCPEALAEFFRRALHRDRNRRPRSAAELGRQLAALRERLR